MNADPNLNFEELERKRLKHAMGLFATGVTVVATQDGAHDVGMTCNSFNTVSLDPPMVLWSIRKASASRDIFLNATGYTVSVLASDQRDVALGFTKGLPHERFAGVDAWRNDTGRLIVGGASAWFDCELEQSVSAGDHDILIGRVVAYGAQNRDPMIYLNGAFVRASS